MARHVLPPVTDRDQVMPGCGTRMKRSCAWPGRYGTPDRKSIEAPQHSKAVVLPRNPTTPAPSSATDAPTGQRLERIRTPGSPSWFSFHWTRSASARQAIDAVLL